MIRQIVTVAIVIASLGCNRAPDPTEAAVAPPNPAPHTAPSKAAVSLVPPAGATQIREGVFITTSRSGPAPVGARIEEMREIFFVETLYDEKGSEWATSVPSSSWPLLTADQRLELAGMRSGDRRRFWRCKEGRDNPCSVEDVTVFEGSEVRAP